MARPNAVVDQIKHVAGGDDQQIRPALAAAPQYLEVAFAGGRTGVLDLSVHRSAVWAGVLRSLFETGQPAYVEIDPQTRLITELLLPIRYNVVRILATDDGLLVELFVSQAPHHVRRGNPEMDELRRTLETALEGRLPVLITETDEHDIVDARLLEEGGGTGG
jgi:hypothetical protein